MRASTVLLALASPFVVSHALAEEAWTTRESMPPQVVLVLKLLTDTHARPTTGVVLSADGLVLVPADFVAAGDEIVVLDGGTDVFRHGRPARTVHRSAQAGVAVLQVDGLRRDATPLADGPVTGMLHLAAFPAAEQLAQGALPLWVAQQSGGELKLPNLPGPVLDRCGRLAGYVLPGDATPRMLASAELNAALSDFGLALPTAACGAVAETSPTAEPVVEPSKPVVEAASPQVQEPEQQPATDPVLPEMAAVEPEALPQQEVPEAPPEPAESNAQTVAVTAATALGLLAWWWFRWRRRKPRLSSEPDTIELLAARGAGTGFADITPASPGDALLLLQARLPDAPLLEIRHAVSTGGFALTVGREGELRIDHPSLSRAHARISGNQHRICVEDLGSTNGTLLGPVPCLPGEVLYLEPGATLLLGEIPVTVLLEKDSAKP